MAQALAELELPAPVQICVVADGVQGMERQQSARPEQATLLGPCRVIPQECEQIGVSLIDVVAPAPGTPQTARLAEQIVGEINAPSADAFIAYRGYKRWAQTYEPIRLERADEGIDLLPPRCVTLITGGLGGVGMLLAEYLAERHQARLVLVGRSSFPAREEWEGWLTAHDAEDITSRKIRRLQALEGRGAEVMTAHADVARPEQLQAVVSQAISRFGCLDGVIHAAGAAGEQSVKLLTAITPADCELQFHAKAHGLYALENVLRAHPPRFCMLFSSNAAVLGGLGSVAYSAANLFMDAFAQARDGREGTRWISVNWDGWLLEEQGRLAASFQTSLDQYAMTPRESGEAFARILANPSFNQVIVSTGDLASRLELWVKARGGALAEQTPSAPHPRPALGVAYAPPRNELEQKIVEVWQSLLGVEQLGVNDNFFDLGGNSLLSLKVVARLKKELGIELPVVAIFEGPTVSALAEVIGRNGNLAPAYKESHRRGERRRERQRRTGTNSKAQNQPK
jgi:NAD(P)-dependent dehydrogenase (short-subunit alcohol dehydrogenase family)/acyl carrier protein